MAVRVCENAMPDVAERAVAVVFANGAAIAILSCCCCVRPAESVNVTVKSMFGPVVAVGVPEITPVEAFSCNPAGKPPDVTDQV